MQALHIRQQAGANQSQGVLNTVRDIKVLRRHNDLYHLLNQSFWELLRINIDLKRTPRCASILFLIYRPAYPGRKPTLLLGSRQDEGGQSPKL